jgi:hypothetical protein
MVIISTAPQDEKDPYASPIVTRNGHGINYTARHNEYGIPTVTDMSVTNAYSQTITRLGSEDMSSLGLSLMMREAGNATVASATERRNELLSRQQLSPSVAKYIPHLPDAAELGRAEALLMTGDNMLKDSLKQLHDLAYRIDSRMEGKEKGAFAAPVGYAEFHASDQPQHGVGGGKGRGPAQRV